MEPFYIWFVCIMIAAILQQMVMTKLYLKNYDLAKKILGDREGRWKTRGFGWMLLGDSDALFRLAKVILLREDSLIITPTIRFIYAVCIAVIIMGLVQIAFILLQTIFLFKS